MTAPTMIGVIGLGTMGLGIVQVFAQAGFHVVATDAITAARESALLRLTATLTERVAAGKLAAEVRDATLARISIVADTSYLSDAVLIVEAIIETLDAKRSLFSNLETVVTPNAVLASNTSSLSVAAIAKGMKRPMRVLGLHFFNPAPVMKLVELVAHDGTDALALTTARTITESAGKTVVVCPDRPGFIVNRCARPYYGEALALLEEGRSAHEIDAAMIASGYRMGPFSLIDLVGADINLAATRGLSLAMNQHPRYHVFGALAAQVAKGEFGRKTGRGFIFPEAVGAPPRDAADIALRIEAALANEAASLLSEGGVDVASIETAMKLGLNFPCGPFEAARAHGLPRIRETLKKLETEAPPHLKGRYVLSPALETMT